MDFKCYSKAVLWGLIQSYDPRKSLRLKQCKAPKKIHRKSCGFCILVFKIHLYSYLTVCLPASCSLHVQHQLRTSPHLTLVSLPTQNWSPFQAHQHFPIHPPQLQGSTASRCPGMVWITLWSKLRYCKLLL